MLLSNVSNSVGQGPIELDMVFFIFSRVIRKVWDVLTVVAGVATFYCVARERAASAFKHPLVMLMDAKR